MPSLLRLSSCAAFAGLMLAGAAAVPAEWGNQFGWDAFEEAVEQLSKCREEGERLDAKARVTLERIRVKEQLARDVIEGRRSLLEAAACMREVVRECPAYWELARGTEPCETEDEDLCCHVISCVEAALYLEPERAAAEAARLRAELRRHAAAGLRLPSGPYNLRPSTTSTPSGQVSRGS
jgi:hypothetical protein